MLAASSQFPEKIKLGQRRSLTPQHELGLLHNTNYRESSRASQNHDDEYAQKHALRLELKGRPQVEAAEQLNWRQEMEIEAFS